MYHPVAGVQRRPQIAAHDALGELIYEARLQVTGVVEYGASLAAVMSGEAPSPCGLRVDVAFEGPVTGRLAGTIRGVDYVRIRADRRTELDVRAEFTTDDGDRPAELDGSRPRNPHVRLGGGPQFCVDAGGVT
jgi:hypothetical protein